MRSHQVLVSVIAVAVTGAAFSCSSSDKKSSDGGAGTMSGGMGGSSPSHGGSSSGGGSRGGAAHAEAGEAGMSNRATGGGGEAGTGMVQGDAGEGGAPAAGPGPTGWTAMPLLDDKTDPNHVANRSGNDLVSGIYFASPNNGWVTTRGSQDTFGQGGAVYKAKGKSLTSILFSGNRDGLCQVGGIDFQGIDKSSDGFVALGYACDVIASHDNGKTFDIQPNQPGADPLGIEQILAMRPISTGTLMFADSGYLDTTAGAPGPTADWSTLWAPEAVPPTPNPVPDADCQVKQTNAQPSVRTVVYISPTADVIAYVADSADQMPIVCVSKDGGANFLPKALPGAPDDAADLAPNGVVFASSEVGITFWANHVYPGKSYIYRTTDAGDTWASVPLPAIAAKSIELYSAFFAPDGTNGWIVGYNYDSSSPLLLRTTDAGATWTASGGDLATQTASAGVPKLYTGFALDAYHIWVGGDYGILMANDAGGD